MKHFTLGILGLGLAAAATTAGTAPSAHAQATGSMPDEPLNLCMRAYGDDRVLRKNDAAILVFEGDGNLALYATNAAEPIWSTNTGVSNPYVTNRTLCMSSSGTMTLSSSTSTLWSRTASASTIAVDDDCDLTAKTAAGVTEWEITGVCPSPATANVATGWCADTSVEATLAETGYAALKWLTTGKLAVVGLGARSGQVLWSTPTAAAKLCFEDGGLIATYPTVDSTTASWTSGARGDTEVEYLFGLDDCALTVANASTGATTYTTGTACPHAVLDRGSSVTGSSTRDTVILENQDARLRLERTRAIVLETLEGERIWEAGTGISHTVSFQGDGNLVIYGPWGATWATGTNPSGYQTKLEGCQLSVVDGTGAVLYKRGWGTDCDASNRAMDGSVLYANNHEYDLLRTDESYLRWKDNGQLCLYTTSGTSLWCVGSSGTNNKLTLGTDGTLAIASESGTSLYSNKLQKLVVTSSGWLPSYTYKTASKLRLVGCTLTGVSSDGTTVATLNSDCTVAKYSYETTEGNSTFGVSFDNSMTADGGTTKKVTSGTGMDVTIFGIETALYDATLYNQQLSSTTSLTGGGVTVLGVSQSLSFSLSKDFFSKTQNYMVGIVPVVVTASASGSLGLTFEQGGTQLSVRPYAGLYATLKAGVGAGTDAAGVSAGLKGELTLLAVSLPIVMSVYPDSAGNWRFNVTGSLVIETLGGVIALYAEAYVKVLGITASVEYSKSLFSWTGLEWTKTLFSSDLAF